MRETRETEDLEPSGASDAGKSHERTDPPGLKRTDPPDLQRVPEEQQRDPEELRREIEDTRADVGETVEALAHKSDVKGRLSDKLRERRAALRERRDGTKQTATDVRNRVARATPQDAKRAATRVAHEAQARPLPAIGAAAAIGFVVGRIIGRR